MPPFFKPTKPARRNAKPQAKAKRRAPRKAAEPEPITKSALASAIRQALGQGTPGAWASDHLAESQRLVGFHYCAIHAKAKQCAAANVEVFEDKGGAKQKSRLKSHGQEIPENLAPMGEESALVRLLSRPHPGCSASTFLYDIAQQHDMTGSALIVKVRNRAGLPVELYVIPTGAVQGMPPTPQYPNGFYQVGHNLVGSLWRDSQGFTELRGYQALSGAIIPPEDMIVIRWPHPILRDDGYGAIAAGALWSDTALQVDQSRWAHLKNGINPSFGVTVDGDVTQQQINDALKGLDQNYAGPHNVGRPFVMPKGREITPLSMSAVEMDYIGAFTQLRDAILALHGTPGVAAGITDGGSYAAFYAALKQFITLTVQPLLDLIAGELREQLAVEFEGDGRRYVIWLTASAIDDPEVLERRLATDISAQAITVNEIRALRGLPPRPDGDKYAGAPPAPPAGAPPGLAAGMPNASTTGRPGVPKLEDAAAPLTKSGDGGCGTGAGGFKPGNTCGKEEGGGGESGGSGGSDHRAIAREEAAIDKEERKLDREQSQAVALHEKYERKLSKKIEGEYRERVEEKLGRKVSDQEWATFDSDEIMAASDAVDKEHGHWEDNLHAAATKLTAEKFPAWTGSEDDYKNDEYKALEERRAALARKEREAEKSNKKSAMAGGFGRLRVAAKAALAAAYP